MEQGQVVLDAVAAGAIPPGQGAQLMAAISQLARSLEMQELSTRLTELEARISQTGGKH
jgi:hypothetical protein